MQQEKQAITSQTRIKNAEDLIDQRMAEFSALGVDLDTHSQPCVKYDPEYIRRYNTARAKMDEIEALAEAYNLKAKYSSFFKIHPLYINFPACFDENGKLKK